MSRLICQQLKSGFIYNFKKFYNALAYRLISSTILIQKNETFCAPDKLTKD